MRPRDSLTLDGLPQPEGRMRSLWRRMTEIYGPRWSSSYGEDAANGAGETWAKGLVGVELQQFTRGLEACIVRNDPWPPTLPEFRAMCLGIPSLWQVRQELMRKADPTPFGRAVWALIDSHAFRHASQRDADAMVAAAYADVREDVMRGRELPAEPIARIEPPKAAPPKPADPAKVRAHMERLAKRLGLSEAEALDLAKEGPANAG